MDFSKKPIIAMLHLKADSTASALERMKRETETYYNNEVDAVLVENYFGSIDDCEQALEYLYVSMPEKCYGVNILGDYSHAFSLADRYGADFIQIDSVCGHLSPTMDRLYASDLDKMRTKYPSVCVLGGVRFKYQPILSGRSFEEDVRIGMKRCDAVVTTGDGTGIDCPTEKLEDFRKIMGNYPLVVGAGVTADTVEEKLRFADAVIIGSWLKEGHDAYGDVSEEFTKAFMSRVIRFRNQGPTPL